MKDSSVEFQDRITARLRNNSVVCSDGEGDASYYNQYHNASPISVRVFRKRDPRKKHLLLKETTGLQKSYQDLCTTIRSVSARSPIQVRYFKRPPSHYLGIHDSRIKKLYEQLLSYAQRYLYCKSYSFLTIFSDGTSPDARSNSLPSNTKYKMYRQSVANVCHECGQRIVLPGTVYVSEDSQDNYVCKTCGQPLKRKSRFTRTKVFVQKPRRQKSVILELKQ